MIVLYDSLLSVLFFALISLCIAEALYFKGNEGYITTANTTAVCMGWVAFLPLVIYRGIELFLSKGQKLIFSVLLAITIILAIYIFYSLLVRANKISGKAYFRNIVVTGMLVFIFEQFHYNTYLLKTFLLGISILSGLTLAIVQRKYKQNKNDALWRLFIAFGISLLGLTAYFEYYNKSIILLMLQSIGVIIILMGLAVNFKNAVKISFNKKIDELEKQNRRLFEAEVQVLKYAYKDQITGLPNYSSFHSTLTSCIGSKKNHSIYLLYLDLDDFRRVNAVVGFAEGNEILKACSQVITSILPPKDKLFRTNGSRFALIHYGDMQSAQTLSDLVIKTVNDAEELRTNSYFRQGVSIGITVVEPDKDFNTIVNQAEIAMYKVKEQSKNNYLYFNELHEQEYKKLLELEGKLKNATKDNVWNIYLQPQVSVDNNEIIGLEALIRWFDGDRYIPPDEFIPLAEKNGLIINIGDDVINKVFALMRDCRANYACDLKFSINVSAVEIFDPSFIERMRRYIEEYEIDPSLVTLELTETAILDNVQEAQVILSELREMKLSISIDDFGSGFTSLYYLSHLPIDEVKIDKSFIDNIIDSEKDKIMLNHFTQLCHDLGLRVVAEGVETNEQLDYVKSIGCDLYQGYYFSKPLSYENMCKSFSGKTEVKSS